jgi:hypothetical protein
MLQKENNVEQRQFHSQTDVNVNNNMQQHGNTLTSDLVQCDSFKS